MPRDTRAEPPDGVRVRIATIMAEMEEMFNGLVTLHEMSSWMTQAYIMAAIRRTKGNRSAAAKLLGVHRNTLARIIGGKKR